MSQTLETGSLEALLESAKLLHSSLELEQLLLSLLRSVMGRLVVSRGVIALEGEDGQLTVAASRGVKALPPGSPFDFDAATDAGIDLILAIGDPEPTGYLGLGKPLTGRLGSAEREFLEALLGIAASAISNARAHAQARRLNEQLDRRVHQLRTLLELVRSLTATFEPDQVAQVLGLTLAGQWLVSKSAVVAWKPGHPTIQRQRGMSFRHPESLRAELQALGGPRRTAELPPGALRRVLEENQAQVVVPLLSGGSAIGFVALGMPAGDRCFQDEDLTFCEGLASQASVAFENGWHFAETVQKEKLDRDLALAGDIQKRLFPSALPHLPGCELAARNRPAAQVGGDYYDALPVQNTGEHCLLCVADVSGKGVAASLVMSSIQATLRALLGSGLDLAALVERTNTLLHATTPANKYVTAIFVLLDARTGACRYVNAGHNEGLLVRADGTVEQMPACGVPIGLFPSATYSEGEVTLEPGDLIALYSDGVTEANDTQDQEFELDRLIESLRQRRTTGAEEIVAGVFADVDAFAGEAPQYDDITLLVLKRTTVSGEQSSANGQKPS